MNKYNLINVGVVIYDQKSNPGKENLIVDAESCNDGFHTFDELYEHRCALFCALMQALYWSENTNIKTLWKSKKHSDGKIPFGDDRYFVCGMDTKFGQVTYHMKIDPWWNRLPDIGEYDIAPEYDGHTSKDVIERLLKI